MLFRVKLSLRRDTCNTDPGHVVSTALRHLDSLSTSVDYIYGVCVVRNWLNSVLWYEHKYQSRFMCDFESIKELPGKEIGDTGLVQERADFK